ncbi:hypothetical protein AJ87_36425 [Rhizobium yanglingense]|nr:hypothetical protein AJ87_36425 [Rhizobium yanglingense]
MVTGTHLSNPRTEAAVMKALQLARKHDVKTALDIDYRPNLWGVAGHGDGESRFVESRAVTEKLRSTLHLFDLIVGTEEEFHIAGGSTNTVDALRAVRQVSDATLICKRGALGAVAIEDWVPNTLDDAQKGPGFPIEVFNVLGAGDGFFAGLLKGWLDGESWPRALEYANACGAFAVSRHGCTPAYPSLKELRFFLKRGVKRPASVTIRNWNRFTGRRTAAATGRACMSSPSTTACSSKRCRATRWSAAVISSFSACRPHSVSRTAEPDMASCATIGSVGAHFMRPLATGCGSDDPANGRDRVR